MAHNNNAARTIQAGQSLDETVALVTEFADDHRHHLYGGPADAWFPNGYVEAGAQRDQIHDEQRLGHLAAM